MKNYIIGALMLLCISACDPDRWLSGHQGLWYLKNTTDIPLEIICPKTQVESTTIVPGDSIRIYNSSRYLGDNEFPIFEDFLKMDSIYVYDANGNKLCEWLVKDTAKEERSVYKEKTWKHYKEHIAGPEYAFIWVFDIQNEDIENLSSLK